MPDYLIASPKVWDGMDKETQATFTKLLNESVDTELDLFAKAVDTAKAESEKAGAKFNDADVDAFREATKPLIEEKVTTDRTKAIYDAIQKSRG
jgi:TRAP-type C4-dicarboxylate transport system substrate-binding protein